MVEAIQRADSAGKVLASNKRIDSLFASGGWQTEKNAPLCWTGTIAGYVEPGRTFREAGAWSDTIKCHAFDYIDDVTNTHFLFPIPDGYLDRKDSILIAEHPDFRLESDGNNWIVRAAKVALIERFPAKDGWCLTDSQFGIPFGDTLDESISDARYLRRIAIRVGLVARGYSSSWSDGNRQYVDLYDAPSNAFGVAVVKAEAKG